MSRFLREAGLLASAAYVAEGRSASVADYVAFLETTAARARQIHSERVSVTFSFAGTGFVEVEIILTDKPENGNAWACLRTGLAYTESAYEDGWYALYGGWETQATSDPTIASVLDRLKDLSEK
jgi:hypothetical protein